jgi:DnaK suppressor protein
MTSPHPSLSEQQLRQIRDELERTLGKLERSLRTNGGGHSHEIDQSAVGRLSRIEALQNKGLTQNLKERERTQFEEVLQALGRLDDGTYGLCARCRSAIGADRLLVFPETRTCSDCPGGH